MEPHFPLGYALSRAEQPSSQQAARDLVKSGACVVCLKTTHYSHECPLLEHSERARQFKTELDLRYKRELDLINK